MAAGAALGGGSELPSRPAAWSPAGGSAAAPSNPFATGGRLRETEGERGKKSQPSLLPTARPARGCPDSAASSSPPPAAADVAGRGRSRGRAGGEDC